MRRHLIAGVLVGALAIAAVALGGCTTDSGTSGTTSDGATDGGATPMEASVVMQGLAFDPSTVEVGVGGSVTWTNEDSVPHTVTGDGGLDSGSLAQGESYTTTFDTAGTYEYACTIHPSMTGVVEVK